VIQPTTDRVTARMASPIEEVKWGRTAVQRYWDRPTFMHRHPMRSSLSREAQAVAGAVLASVCRHDLEAGHNTEGAQQ
jgi:hypothetical protein